MVSAWVDVGCEGGGGRRGGGNGLSFFFKFKRERDSLQKKKDLNYLNILSAVGFTTRLVTAGLCLVC